MITQVIMYFYTILYSFVRVNFEIGLIKYGYFFYYTSTGE